MLKLFWVVLLVGLCWFVYAHRMSLFVRDPLGAVTRDGVAGDTAKVYVNYGNDVVLDNERLPRYLDVVQHGQPVGVPTPLRCLLDVVCLAEGNPVPQIAPVTGAPAEEMTSRRVQFKDENGREVVVKLR